MKLNAFQKTLIQKKKIAYLKTINLKKLSGEITLL